MKWTDLSPINKCTYPLKLHRKSSQVKHLCKKACNVSGKQQFYKDFKVGQILIKFELSFFWFFIQTSYFKAENRRKKGKWSEWSNWSSCSKTCGFGKKERTRSCQSKGKCLGRSKIRKVCAQQPVCCNYLQLFSILIGSILQSLNKRIDSLICFEILLSTDCGTKLGRIVGGSEVTPHSIPWQVALKLYGFDFPTCGGTNQ